MKVSLPAIAAERARAEGGQRAVCVWMRAAWQGRLPCLPCSPGRRLAPGPHPAALCPGNAPRSPAPANAAPRAPEGRASRLRAGGAPGWRQGNLTCMMEVKKDEKQAAVLDKGEEDECLVELHYIGTMF
ncbi:unnamed protein product [Eretmochelys imbricata]